MSTATRRKQLIATSNLQQVPIQLLEQQGQQHEQETQHALLGELGADSQAQCLQALQTLRRHGFQVLLQPAGQQFPAVIQFARNSQADRLQAESAKSAEQVNTQQGGASPRLEALPVPLESCALLPGQQDAIAPLPPASTAASAVIMDAVATIVAPGRSSAKQRPTAPAGTQPAAASNRQNPQKSFKRKAAAVIATEAEEAAEAAEAAVEEAPAAAEMDSKYRDSQLLAFGQQLADQMLTQLKGVEASAKPSDGYEVPTVMRLLQPIVDRMQQDNPAALGEAITPEHKACTADICRKGSGSPGVEGTEGLLRYEQIEQLFSQLNVSEASAHLGIGKTKFKAICRSFGIIRWPFREFCSIYLAQEYLDGKSSRAKAKDAPLLPGRRLLLIHALQLLQQHPNMEFRGHPAYVLTQVLHKQKHKKRKTEERHADETAAQVLTHIRAAGSSGSRGADGTNCGAGTA